MLAERAGRLVHPGSSSETRLLTMLRDNGIKGARPQVEIFDGNEFVARPDIVFESLKLAIEVWTVGPGTRTSPVDVQTPAGRTAWSAWA
jgi:hypothetical protein